MCAVSPKGNRHLWPTLWMENTFLTRLWINWTRSRNGWWPGGLIPPFSYNILPCVLCAQPAPRGEPRFTPPFLRARRPALSLLHDMVYYCFAVALAECHATQPLEEEVPMYNVRTVEEKTMEQILRDEYPTHTNPQELYRLLQAAGWRQHRNPERPITQKQIRRGLRNHAP